MEKDKLIEEMANTLYDNRPYRELWLEDALEIAETLVKQGYRKIPEGSVVLTREERIARDYECQNIGYEVGKKEAHKETAKEIIAIIKEMECADLDYIAKQYGVEE